MQFYRDAKCICGFQGFRVGKIEGWICEAEGNFLSLLNYPV